VIFSDIIAFLLTYLLMGGTMTAIFAGIIVSLLTHSLLYIVANPNDFLYIPDFLSVVKSNLEKLKDTLKEVGTEYREKKMSNGGIPNAV
jgi:hypothetical protein